MSNKRIEHNAFKVARAAVDLVCSPSWNPTTEEERALQQVLYAIGWVMENPVNTEDGETQNDLHPQMGHSV